MDRRLLVFGRCFCRHLLPKNITQRSKQRDDEYYDYDYMCRSSLLLHVSMPFIVFSLSLLKLMVLGKAIVKRIISASKRKPGHNDRDFSWLRGQDYWLKPLPLAHSGKSKLFQNFAALHDQRLRRAK